MKKRLTENQFQEAVRGLDVSQQTLEIAHAVLVLGAPQTEFAQKFQLSRAAVSQTVKRVWDAYADNNLPKGYERLTVILPSHRAYIVKQWQKDAIQELGSA